MSNFVNFLFPAWIDYGLQSQIITNTHIAVTENGREFRTINWKHNKLKFNLLITSRENKEVDYLKKLCTQFYGPGYSFKFKDWNDYKCYQDESFGDFTGLPYVELFKKYEVTDLLEPYYRRIELVAKEEEINTYSTNNDELYFSCFINNIEQENYTVDYLNGRVYFQPEKTFNISNISKSSNALVTTSQPHTFNTGDKIYLKNILGNMSFLNDRLYTITVNNSNSFYLNFNTESALDTSTSGNCYYYKQNKNDIFTWEGTFFVRVRFETDINSQNYDDFNSHSFNCSLVEVRS